MHFSKSPRSTFQTDNYNPPPGYYMGNTDQKDVMNLIKTQSVIPQFLKQERFPENLAAPLPDYNTLDGFDRIAYNSSFKKTFNESKIGSKNYVHLSQTQTRKQAHTHKKNAVNILKQVENLLNSQLSISPPGQFVVNKQQHLLDKLNMLANQDTPGPGSYEAKYSLTKPRAIGWSIKEEDKLPQKEEPNQNTEVLYGSGLAPQKPLHSPPKREKQLLSEEYNLELMFAREKKKGGQQQVPPPGAYEIQSQFGKVKELDYKNQCFDSRAPRFKGPSVDENPGPGEYEEIPPEPLGGYMSKLTRPKVVMSNPGLTYTLKDLSKPQRRDGKFPSSFGSGSKRMNEIVLSDTPGPGTYEEKKKKKGPKYGFKTKQKREVQIQQIESFGLSIASEILDKNQKRNNSAKKTNSHMFASSVERFREKGCKEDLGPGSYEVNQELIRGTFNRGNDLFAKSQRVKGNKLMQIGPGSYEHDCQLVKRHMVRDVHF